ncbi:hypothetical protein KCP74_23595 [Salmonella enterica subsp. enterica]|nr:hypothetical protein KCP74_23595 [Salmonella enterica subsp. enterica]
MRAGLLLLLSLAAVLSWSLARNRFARHRRAGRSPACAKRRLHHRLDARLPRTLAGYWQAALGLFGRSCKHSLATTRSPTGIRWALAYNGQLRHCTGRGGCFGFSTPLEQLSWHLAARLSHHDCRLRYR